MVRKIDIKEVKEICDIYNFYVENTAITFEEQLVSAEDMAGRIKEITAELPWLVFTENTGVVGFAYASKWKSRCAYKYSVETTVYLKQSSFGRGIGTKLYKRLLSELKEHCYHTAIAGIALPNDASIALHEKLGFKKVAHFKETGFKFDKWIDAGYWQLIL